MLIRDLQPETIDLLDAAYARAAEVVDADLIRLATARIDHLVADGPVPRTEHDEREADVAAVIDQMLIDVSSVDDDTARRAARHFADGGFADLVMASYIIEARTRLAVASALLLGDRP